MELVYLIGSILSTFFTSLFLSLLLPFRRRGSQPSPPSVTLYEGTVFHERRRPVHHSFCYSVRYALFDLDHASSPPPDHLSAHQARTITQTTGPVFLLTIPPSVGYEQNPLSVYYCYDLEGSNRVLKKCIAEVTNTPWGERVSFVFDPHSDVVVKALHVSPFMDMQGIWNVRTNSPGDNLFVAVSVNHPKLGNHFTATLNAKKVPISLVSNYALFFLLMPHKVAIWIYWHALKLWWKGVPFVQHPRYTNPAYREEALIGDRKLKCSGETPGKKDRQRQVERSDFSFDQRLVCSQAVEVKNDKYSRVDGSDICDVCERNYTSRWFSWRDAKWPWS